MTTELTPETETLDSQINRLAQFIMHEVPGEPSQSQGAVDTAIRWMREHLTTASPRKLLEAARRVHRVFAGAYETQEQAYALDALEAELVKTESNQAEKAA